MPTRADIAQTRAELVGHHLEQLRTTHPDQLSQTTLAERVGVTQQEIDRWEKGRCEPRLATLKRLAEVFDVHWTRFYTPGECVTSEVTTT